MRDVSLLLAVVCLSVGSEAVLGEARAEDRFATYRDRLRIAKTGEEPDCFTKLQGGVRSQLALRAYQYSRDLSDSLARETQSIYDFLKNSNAIVRAEMKKSSEQARAKYRQELDQWEAESYRAFIGEISQAQLDRSRRSLRSARKTYELLSAQAESSEAVRAPAQVRVDQALLDLRELKELSAQADRLTRSHWNCYQIAEGNFKRLDLDSSSGTSGGTGESSATSSGSTSPSAPSGPPAGPSGPGSAAQ